MNELVKALNKEILEDLDKMEECVNELEKIKEDLKKEE